MNVHCAGDVSAFNYIDITCVDIKNKKYKLLQH